MKQKYQLCWYAGVSLIFVVKQLHFTLHYSKMLFMHSTHKILFSPSTLKDPTKVRNYSQWFASPETFYSNLEKVYFAKLRHLVLLSFTKTIAHDLKCKFWLQWRTYQTLNSLMFWITYMFAFPFCMSSFIFCCQSFESIFFCLTDCCLHGCGKVHAAGTCTECCSEYME